MMESTYFTSEATQLGRKSVDGGGMTQSQVDAIYGNLGSAVTADAANTHDVTITTPAAGLSPSFWPDDLTRDLLLLVNKGRNDLGAAAMGSILTSLSTASIFPPVNTAAPVVSSASLSVAADSAATATVGTWTNAPTSYTYQWLRNTAPIAGQTAQTHLLVAADIGFNLSCMVTAHNADGTGNATSNAIGPVTA